MKDIKIEDAIYLCKYHDTDKNISKTLKMEDRDIVKALVELKKSGLYERYRNMSAEECKQIINANKQMEQIIEDKPKQRNKLLDLNDYLFEELNTLMRDNLTDEELERELKISKQVTEVAQTIINNGKLLLDAKKHFDSVGEKGHEVAALLRLED